jgi:hypothetical protein
MYNILNCILIQTKVTIQQAQPQTNKVHIAMSKIRKKHKQNHPVAPRRRSILYRLG